MSHEAICLLGICICVGLIAFLISDMQRLTEEIHYWESKLPPDET